LEKGGLTVEGDNCDFVGNVADDRGEHRGKRRSDGAELIEFAGAGATDFDDDDEGQRSVATVLLEGQCLRDPVIGQDEVVGGEGEDEITGLVADECGRENKSRASAEERGLRGLLGRGDRRLREQRNAQCHENA
jgi:hypothetical protein